MACCSPGREVVQVWRPTPPATPTSVYRQLSIPPFVYTNRQPLTDTIHHHDGRRQYLSLPSHQHPQPPIPPLILIRSSGRTYRSKYHAPVVRPHPPYQYRPTINPPTQHQYRNRQQKHRCNHQARPPVLGIPGTGRRSPLEKDVERLRIHGCKSMNGPTQKARR